MAKLILFGTPLGFQDTGVPNLSVLNFLQSFDNGDQDIKMSVSRLGNSMHYVFLVYPKNGAKFFEYQGRAGAFFGMDMILSDQEVTNTKQLYQLFLTTYDNYVKNYIVEYLPNGDIKYKISKFNNDILNHVGNGFMNLLKTQPELDFTQSIKSLSPVHLQNQRF